MIAEGTKAPDFALPNQDGRIVTLKQFRGTSVVLYFYPKDNTPGCTTEACDFRDNMARLTAAGAVVLGVSPDSAASHQKFRAKYDLPFELLSDENHDVLDAYGVWKEKSLYGRTFLGIERTTVVIGADGAIARIFRKVKVAGHVDAVMNVLSAL